MTDELNLDKVVCPICFEQRKNTKSNKIFYDPLLSDKKKGKITFSCTNHDKTYIHFTFQIFKVKDQIVSVRQFVFQDRVPKD